jgi:VWFA-related protein
MRKLLVLALAGWMAVPGWAAKRMTVAQLGETLSIDLAQHRSDEEIARQVGSTELSERLSSARLKRYASGLALQPRTALALQLLADQSAFLDPPADEKLAAAPPDSDDQQRMLAAARAYAVETWGRLPNFFVSRLTNRFDNGAQVLHPGEYPVRAGLHRVSISARRVTFRDGKEVLDSPAAAATPVPVGNASDEVGLRSWGEFGPALTVVLSDLSSHRVTFSHWEETAGGLAAVYRYEVPREASHYLVTYSYLDTKAMGRTQYGYGGRQRSPQQVANIPKSSEVETFHETPGYRGMLAIDPASGAVLRITIEASLSPGNPLLSASTLIEYAPVTIGDRKFICPVHSLAISQEPGALAGCGAGTGMTMNGVGDLTAWQNVTQHCDNTPVLLINETKFTEYHRFGSTARILTNAAQTGSAADVPQLAAGQAAAKPDAPVNPANPPQPEAATNSPVTAAATADPAGAAAPTASAAPAEPVVPEISLTEAGGPPDAPANSSPPADSGFSIKVTSRLVDVGVVAFDKKGHPVTDLTAADFEVLDNGHKQEIRFFAPAPAGAAPQVPQPAALSPAAEERIFSNRNTEPGMASKPAKAAESGATILLIDESHIAWTDLTYARDQMLKFLEKTAAAERLGLYSMTASGFRVLVEATSDHIALAARLKTFTPSALSLAQAHEEETRNRQQFDEVHNVADLNSVNGNHTDVPDSAQPVDPQLLSMGDDPARASLIILTQVARHLAAMPGHKNLVWVSSDNVLASWDDQKVGIDKSPKDERAFAIRVQEAMNDAHTAVYPFDVSQLEGGAITADMQHRNVELTQAAADNAGTAAAAGGPSAGGGRNMQPGRIQAQMSQDLHPIQGTIREVAAATGGRTIRRTGELAAALTAIVDDGHAIYQLSFSPQGSPDDQYHAITVKISGKKGIALRYRTGYVFTKEATTLKDRFRAAIWRPLDTSEIGVTAESAASGAMTQVKVNITAADLGMEERGGRWMDKLDIFFIQRDDAGLHAQVEGQTLGLRLKSSTYQNVLTTGVPFEGAVAMRKGMSSIRVLVVDENSGRMGSVTIPSGVVTAKQ